MKATHMIYAIVVFSIIASITTPHITRMLLSNDTVTYETTYSNEYNAATVDTEESNKAITEASSSELAIATPVVEKKEETKKEEKKEEVKENVTNDVEQEKTEEAIVYDNMTLEQLSDKLNRVLKSNLSGTGNLFASNAINYGVDPYLAVAIALHETGCNYSCSSAVRNYYNVGGMMSGGSLIHFSSLNDGISSFIKNLKDNYISRGLDTPEKMNSKYAASSSWATRVNGYINKIKNA